MKEILSIGLSIEPPAAGVISVIHVYGSMYYRENGKEKRFAPEQAVKYENADSWLEAATVAVVMLQQIMEFAAEVKTN